MKAKPGVAEPDVWGAPNYHVVYEDPADEHDEHDEERLLLSARRAGRAAALKEHNDPGAYSLVFHGSAVRRSPWPHVHVVPAASVPQRRRAMFWLAFKRWTRGAHRLVQRVDRSWRRWDDAWRVRAASTISRGKRPVISLNELHSELDHAWSELGANGPAPFTDLARRWAEPNRRYHTEKHLIAVLNGLRQHRDLALEWPSLVVAAWFHDAILVPGRHDNEVRSGAFARSSLLEAGARADRAHNVQALILATCGERADDGDAALFVDVDRSVLGGTAAEYDSYVAEVRAEYGWVRESAWRRGRAAVLRDLLEGGVFRCGRFIAERESRARNNMERELAAIQRAGAA